MINKAAYGDLREVGMTDAQVEAVASHIPDWSQCATRQDLADLRQDMGHLESRLIRWMVGIFLTFLALLGGLVTLSLDIYGVLG